MMKRIPSKKQSRVADFFTASDDRRSVRRCRGGAVPAGYLPVSVGEEEKERFLVGAEMLNHPIFAKLLEKSAAKYGYAQKGVLRIPCKVYVFERLIETLSNGGPSAAAAEILDSISD